MKYRVHELARAADVQVDTVRFYQSKGLLDRPRKVGRYAYYSERHLARLRRIRELQRAGYPLAVIGRLLTGGGGRQERALLKALSEERGARTLTRDQLAAESGVPEALIEAVERAGLVDPLGGDDDGWYRAADVEFARAALAVVREGLPLQELIAIAIRHVDHVRDVTDAAIGLFDSAVRHDDDGAEREAEAVVATFQRLLPAVTTLVAHHFQRTLVARALARLERLGDDEGLRRALAATRSGHLEIRWR